MKLTAILASTFAGNWLSSSSDLVEEKDKQVYLRKNPERVLAHLAADIAKNGFFTIMADECTDVSNKEQFVICIRWVDDTLKDVIGLYNVGTLFSNHRGCAATHEFDSFTVSWSVLWWCIKHGRLQKRCCYPTCQKGEESSIDTLLWSCIEPGCRRFNETI